MTAKRGRPAGYRADVTRPHMVSVRLSEDERGWLMARAATEDVREADVVRGLIDDARRSEMDATEPTWKARTVKDGPITSISLCKEIESPADPKSGEAETAIVQVIRNGKPQMEYAQAAYWPAIGRGGVAWGSDPIWSDATSMEDLIKRVLVTGEVVD